MSQNQAVQVFARMPAQKFNAVTRKMDAIPIGDAARMALTAMGKGLGQKGLTLADVAKVNIVLNEGVMLLFKDMNPAYKEVMEASGGVPPARQCVEGGSANVGSYGTIEMIAADGKKEQVSSEGAPAAMAYYSQAVKVGNLLFVSGQLHAKKNRKGNLISTRLTHQIKKIVGYLGSLFISGGAKGHDDIVATVFVEKDLSRHYFWALDSLRCLMPNATFIVEPVSALPLGVQVEVSAVVKTGTAREFEMQA